MPWSPPVPFAPGINVEKTPILNGTGWSYSNLIRFRDGLPEKNGGWQKMTTETLTGTARGMKVWSDLTGVPYAAFGTEQRLEVFSNGQLTDITPLQATTTPTVNFSSVMTTDIITIVDVGAPAGMLEGDWVNVVVPVSVGGLIIQGLYPVASVVTPGSEYTISAAANATSTVNNGGAVPQYTLTNTSTTVTVTLNDNGLALDDPYINQVAFVKANVTLGAYSQWFVSNVVDANNFQFLADTPANANTSGFENNGLAEIQYLVPNGFSTSTPIAGFGEGLFGAGIYDDPTGGPTYTTIRQWFLDQWGQDLIGNYTGSPIFVWQPPVAAGNVAIAITTTNFMSATSPPQTVNVSFVTMPQQIIMALGCDPSGGGNQDPNLIRWGAVGDFTDWVASATNQAGSFRIPTGSRLVGGITGPNFGVIWTDEDTYIFSYIGFPLVFGFVRITGGTGLLSARSRCIAQSVVYWCCSNGVLRFDGSSVSLVQDPVWDVMWRNLNRTQVDKCHMAVNSYFKEITTFFPSATGSGEVDSYVRYNWRENVWDYGAAPTLFTRTTWQDNNAFGSPIGVDTASLIQQHEIGFDADGLQMGEFIQSGYFSIDNGWLFTVINQVIADFKWQGTSPSLLFWILTINYPSDTPAVYGPFTQMPSGPAFQVINARGRMASIIIGSSSIGAWWRLGNFRYLYAPDGQQ